MAAINRAQLNQSNQININGFGKVTKNRHSIHNNNIADYVDTQITVVNDDISQLNDSVGVIGSTVDSQNTQIASIISTVDDLDSSVSSLQSGIGNANLATDPDDYSFGTYNLIGGAGAYVNFLEAASTPIVLSADEDAESFWQVYRAEGDAYWQKRENPLLKFSSAFDKIPGVEILNDIGMDAAGTIVGYTGSIVAKVPYVPGDMHEIFNITQNNPGGSGSLSIRFQMTDGGVGIGSVVTENGIAGQPFQIQTGNPNADGYNIQIRDRDNAFYFNYDNLTIQNTTTDTLVLQAKNAIQSINDRDLEPSDAFKATLVLKDSIKTNDKTDGVVLLQNRTINSSGVVVEEFGSIVAQIPYTPNDLHRIENIETIADGGDSTVTIRLRVTESGTPVGGIATEIGNKGKPYYSGTSNPLATGYNIIVKSEPATDYFDYNKLTITNVTTGEVLFQANENITAIENKGINGSKEYTNEILNKVNTPSCTVVCKGSEDFKRFDASSITMCKDGTLLLAVTKFLDDSEDAGLAHLDFYKSFDGKRWVFMSTLPPDVGSYSYLIPSLYTQANGDIICVFLRTPNGLGQFANIIKVKSTDGGATWGAYTTVTPSDGGYTTMISDRIFKQGSKLFFPINVLVSGDGTSENSVYKGGLMTSIDDGNTWTNSGIDLLDTGTGTQTTVIEPGIYDLPNGDLVYYFRTLKGWCRAFKSTDGGATWGAPYNLFRAANSTQSIKRLNATNNVLEAIYIAVANTIDGVITSHTVDRRFMQVLRSKDGENFERDVMIYNYNNANTVAFEPNIFENGDEVIVTWSTLYGDLSDLLISTIKI